MFSSPPLSPWPAPTADALVWPVEVNEAEQPAAVTARISTKAPAGTIMTLARRLSSEERAQRAAVKAELRLRNQLEDLPAGWHVLHSVDIGEPGRHIDHVVVGPGGVFTLNVEHQLDAKVWVTERQVLINGAETDHLRHSRFEARRSSTLLSEACGFHVAAQSLLILIGAAEVQTVSHPAEVHVRTDGDVRDWLCRQPVRITAETVHAIHERAGRFETWQPKAHTSPPA